MVIGIERFYLHDQNLNHKQVYSRGLVKTIRDLFTGWFQDFCLDHIEQLARIPKHDFLTRFEMAKEAGQLTMLEHSDDRRPVSMIDQAIQMMSDKRYDDAERLLARLLQVNGQDAVALYYQAVCRFNQGDLDASQKSFRASLAQDDQNWQAWNGLGLVLRELSQHDEATQCFRDALERKADFLPALLNLGHMLELTSASSQAVEVYELAQAINPHDDLVIKALERLKIDA